MYRALAFAFVCVVLWGTPLSAQEVPPPTVPAQEPRGPTPESLLDPEVSPAGAFLRGIVLPGWGHIAAGSYARGGFYVAAQSGTAWMLAKSAMRRRQAEQLLELQRDAVASRLRSTGSFDPQTLATEVDQDPAVTEMLELTESRNQQVEDWTALGIFLVLLSGVDAFVAAHLMDYPAPLSLDVRPGGSASAVEVRLQLPVGGR